MKRTAAPGKVVTNFSQGGSVVAGKISEKEESLALAAAKMFSLDYVGVDIMRDGYGNSYILEVNRSCQFEGFEKATGVNVAEKIIKFLTFNL